MQTNGLNLARANPSNLLANGLLGRVQNERFIEPVPLLAARLTMHELSTRERDLPTDPYGVDERTSWAATTFTM